MLDMRHFMAAFPDDRSCRDFIFRIRWPRGFICTKCGAPRYSFIVTRQLYECSACKTQISLTSGTIMHGTKLPLNYWLLAFYWIASGERVSARLVSATLDLHPRSALKLLNGARETMSKINRSNKLLTNWRLNSQEDCSVAQAKQRMSDKSDRFIRHAYRKVSPHNKNLYIHEFAFRNNYAQSPELALRELIKVAFATVWFSNAYAIYGRR